MYFVQANDGPKQGLNERIRVMRQRDDQERLPEEKVPVSVEGRNGPRWVRQVDLHIIRKRGHKRVGLFTSPNQRRRAERCPVQFISI
ncbi:MAG: hypothetical protein HZC26_04275 [Candidatus Magasanikbacteria bacterium]|nr:hypothetical protein [Candidatus Magasanikbacteria bacterium]